MSRRKPNNHGFTLAEVLIAVAVLSVGAFGLLAACYASLRYEQQMLCRAEWQKTADYAYATFRQRCALNPEFLASVEEGDETNPPTLFPAAGLGAYPADERWTWRITAVADAARPGLYRITVRVFDMRERADDEAPEDREAVYTLQTFYAERQ